MLLHYYIITGGLPYHIDSVTSSTPDLSLVSNISCTSFEDRLNKCTINKQTECMKQCPSILGLHCYGNVYNLYYNYIILRSLCIVPGDCTEGSIRLVDGIIEQEGRVEVCINGVWGSICDDGWDKTDAHIVCKQMGFSSLG